MRKLDTCLRRKSRMGVFKDRPHRSFPVGLIIAFAILFFIFYSFYLKQIFFAPSVLSRDEMQDIFVRSTGPRVAILVVSDKIDDTLCYSVGSAYLSGLPVVVAGYQMPFRGFLSKFDILEKAIENLDLQPNDVLIVMDSDTIFTGEDIHPFLDRFIAHSPATPEELDALAVRQGHMMAPFVASGEITCFAPNVFNKLGECRPGFQAVYEKVRKYAAAHPERNLPLTFELSPQHHLNSGFVVARVWAYKEFLQKAVNLTGTQIPPATSAKKWNCDQSIFIALFLDLLAWEVEQDVFSIPLHERQAARSPYDVRAGFMDLDYANALAFSGLAAVLFSSQMHDERWAKLLPLDGHQHPHLQDITDLVSIGRFVGNLFRRAYAAHGKKVYTNLTVPKWIRKEASSEVNITLTPPLFALRPRPIDKVYKEVRRMYPAIFHTPGVEPGFTKVKLLERGTIGARWFVPMVYDAKAKHQAMGYLKSAPLFLSTNKFIIRDSYHAKCGFPFEEAIRKVNEL